MPTPGGHHDKFWQQQPGPTVVPDTLPYLFVGRGTVPVILFLLEPSLLILLGAAALMIMSATGVFDRAKQIALKKLGGNYGELLSFLHSKDGLMAKTALEAKTRWELNSHMAESKALELGYLKAQQMGCGLSGWQLRFALYYWLGKLEGKW